MGNLHGCAAQAKIEIETSNLGDIFTLFLFISNHMSLCQRKNSLAGQVWFTRITALFIKIKYSSLDAGNIFYIIIYVLKGLELITDLNKS